MLHWQCSSKLGVLATTYTDTTRIPMLARPIGDSEFNLKDLPATMALSDPAGTIMRKFSVKGGCGALILFVLFLSISSQLLQQYLNRIEYSFAPESIPTCAESKLLFYGIMSQVDRVDHREILRQMISSRIGNNVTVRFFVDSESDISDEITRHGDIVRLPSPKNAFEGITHRYLHTVWQLFGCHQYYFQGTDTTAIRIDRLARLASSVPKETTVYIGAVARNRRQYTKPIRTAVIEFLGVRVYDVDLAALIRRLEAIWRYPHAWYRYQMQAVGFKIGREDSFARWTYGINRAALISILGLHPLERQQLEDENLDQWITRIRASAVDVGPAFHDRIISGRSCPWDGYCTATGNKSIAVQGCASTEELREQALLLSDDNRPQESWVGIRLVGRLGNQLFLLASAHGIAAARRARWCVSAWDDFVGHDALEWTAAQAPECPSNVTYVFRSEGLFWQRFHPGLMVGAENVIVEDFLESYKYFGEVPFRLRYEGWARRWVEGRGISVGIHVRRGDKTDERWNKVADARFYGAAVARIRQLRRESSGEEPHFVVCSDDEAWVRQQPVFEGMHLSTGHSAAMDLALLAACRDVIFGVGTFGWWAAFLSQQARGPEGGHVVYYGVPYRDGTRWWDLVFPARERTSYLDSLAPGGQADYFPPHWIAISDPDHPSPAAHTTVTTLDHHSSPMSPRHAGHNT